MADSGQKLGSMVLRDDGVAVATDSTATGSTVDIGPSGSPQDIIVAYQFGMGNTSDSSNGVDMDVYVQFSDDGATWPDERAAGWYGTSLGNYRDTQAGSFITRGPVEFIIPLLRYYRFCYYNDSADNYSVSGWSSDHHLIQSA